MYSLHVDLGSTSHENYIYPVLFALLPDKKEKTYHCLLTLLKNWCVFWSPKIIKVDFEAAVISAINKVFPGSVITGCNFHFNQCLWRQIQNIGLAVEYKEDEQVRIICRMCAALAYLPIDKVEEGWLMIMDSVPQNEKLTLFLDYFVKQWMENQNVPIEMWNIHQHRHRTNNAVESWNSKLNSIIGKQHPNVFLLVQKLKEEAELVSWQIKSKELGLAGQKRKRTYVKQDERIERIMAEYDKSNDLYKCLKALSYINTFE